MSDSKVDISIALYLCISLFLDLACCEIEKDTSYLKIEDSNNSFQDFSSTQINFRGVETMSGPGELHKSLYSSNHSTCSSENGSYFCSPWHYCDKGECTCGEVPYNILYCNKKGNLSVLDNFCVTFNANQNLTEVGNCVYNFEILEKSDVSNVIYKILPKNPSELNEIMCGNQFNRNGTLCGTCKDGYFPQVCSLNFTCVRCPHGGANWWKFLLCTFFPLTIFYFIVVFFKINATSSHLHGFIYFSQAISMPQVTHVLILGILNKPKDLLFARYVVAFYGIWNLDFFRSFNLGICLGTDTLQTLSLDLAVGIYPLLLMLLSYVLIDLYDRGFKVLVIMWKPFLRTFRLFRRNWEIRTSVIDAYATFFLLSNVKFLSVSFNLLAPVKVYQLSSSKDFSYTWRLYYDATILYFDEYHLPYAILAIAVLFFFVLLPVLILILYPCSCFQKFLNMFPFQRYIIILHTFVDSFHGCYKNGTEPGTRDCRWFASCFFVGRIILFIVGLATFSSVYFVIASIVIVMFVILLVMVEPFKVNLSHYSNINVIYLLFLSAFYVSAAGYSATGLSQQLMIPLIFCSTFGLLPLLFASANIIYWLYGHRKFVSCFKTRL